MKTTGSEHAAYTNCFLFWHSEQFMYTTSSELVVFMYWTRNLMNSLLSYCGLVDRRKRASDKDLPVTKMSKLNSLSKNRKKIPNQKIFILISKARTMSTIVSNKNWLMKSLRRYQSWKSEQIWTRKRARLTKQTWQDQAVRIRKNNSI